MEEQDNNAQQVVNQKQNKKNTQNSDACQRQQESEGKMYEEQQKHRRAVKSAFANYTKDMKRSYESVFSTQKLPKYFQCVRQRKRQLLERAIAKNQQFLNKILEFTNEQQEQEQKMLAQTKQIGNNQKNINNQLLEQTPPQNIPKIRSTIKQFYRQWCSESLQAQDYVFLASKAKQYLKKGDKIIVPGCGLGRLVLELVELGFGAQGNQVTYFMLFGSNFILNCCQQQRQFEIYPFIHSFSDMEKQQDIFRPIFVPDKVASNVVAQDSDFSMAAGDFTQIYADANSVQGVITCFFIDTANNIFEYIDTIYNMLKPGGIWINYGPLLFHYKDMLDQVSVEISYEQLLKYLQYKGFILQEQQRRQTTYCHDPKSSFTHHYNCILSIWKK